jgi:hypothetical protein
MTTSSTPPPPGPISHIPWFGKAIVLNMHEAEGEPIKPWFVYASPANHFGITRLSDLAAWAAFGPVNPNRDYEDPTSSYRLRTRKHGLRWLEDLAVALDFATLACPSKLFGKAWPLLWCVIAAWGAIAPTLLDGCDDEDGVRWGRAAWVAALIHSWRTLRHDIKTSS